MAKQQLTPKSEDMSKWYTQVIQQAKLADYAPVKGTMVMRPSGYGIWEQIQKSFDPMLKELGVENAYFPLFIPISFFQREAEHVEGFAPELAVVTHGGGEELEEKLAIRPTSETIMYEMYSKWVQSYRDLPLNLNQWNNVVRWEKRTYFFLRTTEFLWQEAHTAHATHAESWQMVLDALESYRTLAEEYLAIPVIKGRKSESEKFAGADVTTTIEALMPDGKALQSGTSHDLGQNFSKKEAFNISFQNVASETDYAWQTSYGLSTRIIGALIMTHGDDDGLVIPPNIAPTQVSIVTVQMDNELQTVAQQISKDLSAVGVRVKQNRDEEHSLGWKLNDVEIQGIPLTLVLGQKELERGVITASIRHSHQKQELQIEDIATEVPRLLKHIQDELLHRATEKRDSLTSEATSYDEFKQIMSTQKGFIKAFWCENEACEKAIKDETKATTRCLPFINDQGDVAEESGTCIKCGQPATHRWIFAQAY